MNPSELVSEVDVSVDDNFVILKIQGKHYMLKIKESWFADRVLLASRVGHDVANTINMHFGNR